MILHFIGEDGMWFMNKFFSEATVIVAVALFLAGVGNIAFFKHVLEVYPFSLQTLPFLFSLFVLLVSTTVVVLELFV